MVYLRVLCQIEIRYLHQDFGRVEAAFGTKLKLSSTYHLQTGGQTDKTIQSLEDFLRACMLE